MQNKEKTCCEQQKVECDYSRKTIIQNNMIYNNCELKFEHQRMSTCIKNGDVAGTLEVLFSEFTRGERK